MSASAVQSSTNGYLGFVTPMHRALRFTGLLASSLVFGLTLAHVLQSPGSRGLDGPTWLIVQHTFYGGFAVVGGAAEIVGLVASGGDAMLSRRRPCGAIAPAFSSLCLFGTLVSYYFGNRPVNAEVAGWTPGTLPADWTSFRQTWEIAHALSALLGAVAFITLLAVTIWQPTVTTKAHR